MHWALLVTVHGRKADSPKRDRRPFRTWARISDAMRSPAVICHARTRAAREPKPQRTVRRAIRPCPTARPRRCSDQMGLMSGRVSRAAGGAVALCLADLLQVRGGGGVVLSHYLLGLARGGWKRWLRSG